MRLYYVALKEKLRKKLGEKVKQPKTGLQLKRWGQECTKKLTEAVHWYRKEREKEEGEEEIDEDIKKERKSWEEWR